MGQVTTTDSPASIPRSSTWSGPAPTCTSPRPASSKARPRPTPSSATTSPRGCTWCRASARSCASCRFDQGRPVWVDDPHLNLDYHVRQTALPAPGSDEQLRNLAARIFSQQLDRSKPLWELWLVEGLTGDRFAIIGKSHHALVDGVSGVDITTVLFDLDAEPTGTPDKAAALARPPRTDRPPAAERGLARAADQPAGDRPRLPRARCAARARCCRASARPRRWSAPGCPPPHSVFNVEIGPHRRFAMVQADLGDLKRVKDAHGGTVNDVDPLDRRRRHRQLPARPRPRHRGARAAGDGPGQRPRRRGARRPRQPDLGDDGAAAGLVRGPGRAAAAADRARWAT